MSLGRAVCVVVGALAGCYQPANPDCAYACGAGSACPSGLTCVNDMCRTDRQPQQLCSCGEFSTLPLFDDFSGTSIDTSLWSVPSSGGSVTESGGTLHANPTSSSPAYPSLVSQQAIDLRNSAAYVELVVPAIDGATSATIGSFLALFELGLTQEIKIVVIQNMTIEVFDTQNGGQRAMAPYSPADMHLLRIREAAGELYFETAASALQAQWSVLFMEPTPAWVYGNDVFISVGASTDGDTMGNVSDAVFDNFDTCGP